MSTVVLAKITGAGLAGLFAGAAAYISLAQHPALEETEASEFQAPFFRRMYFYAARMQAPMSIGSGLSALAVYVLERDAPNARIWLSSGCLMTSIAPYTVVCMLSLNHKLIDTKRCRERGHDWLHRALVRWGRLHHVRTFASVLAFTGMLVAMACQPEQTPRKLPLAPA